MLSDLLSSHTADIKATAFPPARIIVLIKRSLARSAPAAFGRSPCLLFPAITLIFLFWKWRPVGTVLWQIRNPVGEAIMNGSLAFGWVMVLVTALLLDHAGLLGVQQVSTSSAPSVSR